MAFATSTVPRLMPTRTTLRPLPASLKEMEAASLDDVVTTTDTRGPPMRPWLRTRKSMGTALPDPGIKIATSLCATAESETAEMRSGKQQSKYSVH